MRTEYCYLTDYAIDDENYSILHDLLILGMNLKLVSPQYDRVLLIPTDFSIPSKNLGLIHQVWSVIIRKAPIQFDCQRPMGNNDDIYKWFRINMFNISGYKKILYLGKNSIVIKDLGSFFSFPTPSSPLDFSLWSISQFGPVHNHNFLLFHPNHYDFVHLIDKLCDWVETPNIRNQRLMMNMNGDIGPYINGLFEEYFGVRICTLPTYTYIQVAPFIDKSFKEIHKMNDPRIFSFLIPVKGSGEIDDIPMTYHKIFAKISKERLGIQFRINESFHIDPSLSNLISSRIKKSHIPNLEKNVIKHVANTSIAKLIPKILCIVIIAVSVLMKSSNYILLKIIL